MMQEAAPLQSSSGPNVSHLGAFHLLLRTSLAVGTRSVGATVGNVFLIDDTGANLQWAASDGGLPMVGGSGPGEVALVAELPLTEAVKKGRPVVVAKPEDLASRYPGLASTLAQNPARAIACFPLEIDGRVMGVIELAFPLPWTFGEENRVALEALARQWACSFEWGQRLQRSRAASDFAQAESSRLERLHAFTRALAQAIAPEEVVDAIVNVGREATAAQTSALWLLSRNGGVASLARTAGGNRLRPEDLQDVPLSGPPRMAIFDAIRNRAPVWIESRLQLEERYPEASASCSPDKSERTLACLPLFVQDQCIGGLVFKFEGVHRFVEEERAFLQVVAWHSAQAIERSRLYAAEKRAREAAEASQRRSVFLSDAGMILASSLDDSVTLAGIVRVAVPRVADWCIVELEEDRLRGIPPVTAHVDPAKVPLVLELSARYRARVGREYGIPEVVRSGKAQLYASVSMQEIRDSVGDADLARLFEEVGLVSSMVVPILARDHLFGAIVLNSTSRQYDQDDLAMAEQLGRKAGLAVDRARLYREAREADRQKDEFLAMLSHELRNPLAPIVGALDLMKLRARETCATEREVISRNVKHIVRLVDDLLDVARVTRGKIELFRDACEISQVVAKAVEMVAPLINKRGQSLTISVPTNGLVVLADQARLAQAISNLLANANKYTPCGGKISIVALAEASEAVIRIADSGIGIAPETLPKVFDLFVQEKRALDRAQGGLGIGLTVVKALVALHGGSVSAKSDGLGKGSEFAIRIALASPAPAASVPTPQPSAVSIEKDALLRVVVVDDNVDAASMLAETIRALGCSVRVAHDAPSALATTTEFGPNLLLVDIGLPGTDGYELIGHLRGVGAAPSRIVALTGYGQEGDYRRSREAGFDEHIVKPMSIDTLRGVLERSCSFG